LQIIILFFIKRMSLAMYAAPFDNENTRINSKENDNDNPIARKRMSNNRTQKRIPKENAYSDKVNSVLQSIHNSPDHSDNSSELADFRPLPPPTSVGVEQTKLRESMENRDQEQDQDDQTQYQNQNTKQAPDDYYKRFMPNYEKLYKNSPANMPYYTQQPQMQSQNQNYGVSGENSVLLEKLNYMIHLLEEQQDEKTGNVTEEVILYCFLGIFIIFIVDSFVRVGKYVR
jgi:hypothetical protein